MEEKDQTLLNELNAIGNETVCAACEYPDRTHIKEILKLAQVVILPGFFHYQGLSQEEALGRLRMDLRKELQSCFCMDGDGRDPQEVAEQFLEGLPQIKKSLITDIQAIYDGDPAAKSKAEVILCYPGFYAICIYRIAHHLIELRVPFIPRVMTEYAHEKTGIDINPGAKIGDYFCIDHGTGIVIGETAVLGHHVKLYQGVTIGARSFDLDENGLPVKSGKRHPDLGDYVIVYANATILGGDTVIGDHSVIGGNVWLLESVPPGSHITYRVK
ncbi:serine acetyltransferase [Erysipelotrichaceae bacterium Oil+RF-744-GAM-WT-6]|uniref:Serine acetyltransferase n=1 Tax=Stecheria intestinalis TaxID=2606630 RepID=A0A7X2TFB1_9FIRM|nr:serine O-acetyltransferase [Stecheria intestinalis]MSS57995.1 serine acetyltransferase [Stecheria intestinalis]